jgi:tetratricopeptide (TPR) repeat protein
LRRIFHSRGDQTVADKMTRKELREPDAFLKAGGEATSWIDTHRNLVLLVIGGLLLLGGGAAIANYVGDRSDARAAQELGQTMKLYERPVQTGMPNFDAPPGETPFGSQKEKDEAIVKALSDFRAAHKGSPSAVTAALSLAQAQYRLGDYDAAIASYGEFVSKVDAKDPLRAAGLEGRGYAYEAKGNLEEAKKSFEELAKLEKGQFLAGMGQYHQGRLLMAEGKKDEAAKVFTDLRAAFPESNAANLAQDRLTALASEGVKLPAPPPAAVTATDAPKG